MFCNSRSWFHVIHVLSHFQQLHNVPSPLSEYEDKPGTVTKPLTPRLAGVPSWDGRSGVSWLWCGGGGWYMLSPPLPTPVPSGDTYRVGTRAHSRFYLLLEWGSSHVPIWSGLVAQILSGRAKLAALRCCGRIIDKDLSSWPDALLPSPCGAFLFPVFEQEQP